MPACDVGTVDLPSTLLEGTPEIQPAQFPVLIRLGDYGNTVANPAEDIRGRSVLDGDGNDVGKVVDLLIDEDHRKVRFLRIKHWGFLGIGADEIFVPAEAIVQVLDDQVRIDYTQQNLAGAYRPQRTQRGRPAVAPCGSCVESAQVFGRRRRSTRYSPMAHHRHSIRRVVDPELAALRT